MDNRILIIGDTTAKYHPMSSLSKLGDFLCGYNLVFSDDYDYFQRLREFDLCVSYIDAWDKALSSTQSTSLKEYLAGGGNILMLHNGISLQGTPELADVLGARFTHHPPAAELLIHPLHGHPVTEGINDFSIFDEPYHFDIFGKANILATYEFDGKPLPAAWEMAYSNGKMIYLMPGHDESAFKCGEYRKLIKNSIDYLRKKGTVSSSV